MGSSWFATVKQVTPVEKRFLAFVLLVGTGLICLKVHGIIQVCSTLDPSWSRAAVILAILF